MKPKQNKQNQLLQLLKTILPKAIHDPQLVDKIYCACEQELQTNDKTAAFEKFCERCELPDLDPATVAGLKRQFEEAFGLGNVQLTADPEKQSAQVEVTLLDGIFTKEIQVRALSEVEEEQEIQLKFVPFPVCLPGDPELVWLLAKRENMTPDEACIALLKVQEDFWGSKSGQKLLRDRVERSFPEFISRVPAKLLTEVGLKRHYKEPEAIKPLRSVPAVQVAA
jgi:hypothetical protein